MARTVCYSHLNLTSDRLYDLMAVFSRARLSRLTFLEVFCLLTSLSDLKMIGVFTSKIVFHLSNLRRARA